MSKIELALVILAMSMGLVAHAAEVTIRPWTPIFQGIELADGQQVPTGAGEGSLRVFCLRVDLSNPDVHLFSTPKCTNCGTFETLAENTSRFLQQNDLQVAINGGFFTNGFGSPQVPLNASVNVQGLTVSDGVVVSPANDPDRLVTFMFTTNNSPIFVPNNTLGVNLAGIQTAISGDRPLLIGGIVIPRPTINERAPRTAIGVSKDRRYLYMMTIDGYQTGWSDGADYYTTALWMRWFGADDAINLDGGDSTTMVMSDCAALSVRVNRSSALTNFDRERNVGHNIGVRAPSLPSTDSLAVTPGSTTALVTWRTEFPASTQVEYGLTTNFGSATPLDARLTRNHVATLRGLIPGSNYFYQALSLGDSAQFRGKICHFSARQPDQLPPVAVFGLTNIWTYTTNNLDGVNWRASSYDDSGWLGSGPGLLYALENNAQVAPRNTPLPTFGTTVSRTCYFRTRFNFSESTAGASLLFSSHIDDGAVFYLNGTEIYRLRLPAAPTVISYATPANGTPCLGTLQSGDAVTSCPDVIAIGGNLITNLMSGTNLLAVEVHNGSGSDLVFGTSLTNTRQTASLPRLNLWMEGDVVTLFWNGEGFRLQSSVDLTSIGNWTDLPGPITASPFSITNNGTTFYRLRE